MRRALVAVFAIALGINGVLAACDDDSGSTGYTVSAGGPVPDAGGNGQACYGDQTCNGDLTCVSGVCRDIDLDAGTDADGADADSGDADADSGDAHVEDAGDSGD